MNFKISKLYILVTLLVASFFVVNKININSEGFKNDTVSEVIESHTLYPADFSDSRVLMGASHNVFVAKVINQVGNVSDIAIPETQFEVEVVYNIKGSLNGKVIVNQDGGYKDGKLYIIEGDLGLLKSDADGYLLESGKTYLLSTRYTSKDNWYTLNTHPNARKTISSDNNLSDITLEELAKSDLKVKILEEAYKNEVLLGADVKNNNTLNSYESVYGKRPNS